jgi:hypothetical protein
MPSSLNSGFHNNINTMQIRTSGTSMQRVTDRTINGAVSLGTDPPTPVGVPRTILITDVETDGGVTNSNTVSEYTKGTN